MKKLIKKSILTISLVATLSTASFTQKASAAVSYNLAASSVVFGLLTGGPGLLLSFHNLNGSINEGTTIKRVLLGVLGVILLDGEDGQVIQFTELTDEDAKNADINIELQQSLNDDLPLINAALRGMRAEMSENPHLSEQEIMEISEDYRSAFSEETKEVLFKLGQK